MQIFNGLSKSGYKIYSSLLSELLKFAGISYGLALNVLNKREWVCSLRGKCFWLD